MILQTLRSLALRLVQFAHHHRDTGLGYEMVGKGIAPGDHAFNAAL